MSCKFVASDQPRCEKPHYNRGLCVMHFRRLQRHGDPGFKATTLPTALPGEFWAAVVGYEGDYEVSTMGRIRSLKTDRQLATKVSQQGYLCVHLWRDNKRTTAVVHRIVTAAFLGPRPQGLEVCHNDGDKLNASLSNLRYDTRRSNIHDRLEHTGRKGPPLTATCFKGHEWTEKNTRFEHLKSGRIRRACRTCAADRVRRYRKEAA